MANFWLFSTRLVVVVGRHHAAGWPGLAFHHGKSSHGLDRVAGDVGVSHFHSPGTW